MNAFVTASLGFALLGLSAAAQERAPEFPAEQIKKGADLFARNCATCHGARAQQSDRLRRIGVLAVFEIDDPQGQALIKSLRGGLEQRGLIEGRNISMEIRYAGTNLARLPALAAELIHQGDVEVIVTHGTPPVQAAQRASNLLPIVFATIGDPVGAGIVTSLARPGGNVTGLSLIA